MDVNYINPFIETVVQNTKEFAGLDAEKEAVNIANGDHPKMDISAVIGITGVLAGSAVISFPSNIALKVASTMLMDEMTDLNDEVKDAMGEFANIAVGKARNILVDNGVYIRISPPTIVVGEDHNIFFPPKIPVFEVIFKTTMGRFMITLGLKEK